MIRIGDWRIRVIGVLESRGGSSFGSEDDVVLVPLTTAQARLLRRSGRDRVDIIFAQAVSADAVPRATEEIAQILRTRHRTPIGVDDFSILSQQRITQLKPRRSPGRPRSSSRSSWASRNHSESRYSG